MIAKNYRIYALSENTLTLQLESIISEKQIRFLYNLKNTILAQNRPGIHEILVTFYELSILFDCDSISFDLLRNEIEFILKNKIRKRGEDYTPTISRFTIPVCYDVEMALDKIRLEKCTGQPFSELVDLHVHGDYVFYMMGFLPGFMYLGGLDKRLTCPRLETPRQKVLAGSIGIAGQQTGIYPMESPGGWNIIGRTPLTLFDFDKNDGEFQSHTASGNNGSIQPLDKIKFTSISNTRFQEIQGLNVVEYQKIHQSN